jgi:hypothetical protein
MLSVNNGYLMWFNLNGHFAKNNKYDSEVFHEPKTNQTTLHERI